MFIEHLKTIKFLKQEKIEDINNEKILIKIETIFKEQSFKEEDITEIIVNLCDNSTNDKIFEMLCNLTSYFYNNNHLQKLNLDHEFGKVSKITLLEKLIEVLNLNEVKDINKKNLERTLIKILEKKL